MVRRRPGGRAGPSAPCLCRPPHPGRAARRRRPWKGACPRCPRPPPAPWPACRAAPGPCCSPTYRRWSRRGTRCTPGGWDCSSCSHPAPPGRDLPAPVRRSHRQLRARAARPEPGERMAAHLRRRQSPATPADHPRRRHRVPRGRPQRPARCRSRPPPRSCRRAAARPVRAPALHGRAGGTPWRAARPRPHQASPACRGARPGAARRLLRRAPDRAGPAQRRRHRPARPAPARPSRPAGGRCRRGIGARCRGPEEGAVPSP